MRRFCTAFYVYMSFFVKLFISASLSKTMMRSVFAAGTGLLAALLFSFDGFAQELTKNTDPETYFDFWIGIWNVHWQEGENGIGRGTNRVEKILDDTVIQEHFRITEGQSTGFMGTSISVYHSGTGSWKQAWADNEGSYFDFTGRKEGEKRIFQTDVSRLEDGREFTQRMVFYDITENSLTWDWESSGDGGENWTLDWRIFYERVQN